MDILLPVVDVGVPIAQYGAECWYDGVPTTPGEGDWLDCIVGPFFEQLGRVIVVMILGGFYSASLYWYTHSIYPPAVILSLFVGLLVLGAPAPMATVAGLLVTIALALAYMSIYRSRGRV